MSQPEIAESWDEHAEQISNQTPLTERQAEVLVLQSLKSSVEQTATLLGISDNTVERHRSEARQTIAQSEKLVFANLIKTRVGGFPRPLGDASFEGVEYFAYATPNGGVQFIKNQPSPNPESGQEFDQRTSLFVYKDVDELVEGFKTGTHFSSFGEAVASYKALGEKVEKFPSLVSLVETPTAKECSDAVEQGLLTKEEASRFTGAKDTKDSTHPIVGYNNTVPIEYPFAQGGVNLIVGRIGSGKTSTAKLLVSRLSDIDESAKFVCIDPLAGFEDLVQSMNGKEIRPNAKEDNGLLNLGNSGTSSDELGRMNYVNLADSPSPDDIGDFMQQSIESLHGRDDADEIVLVIDEAHYLLQNAMEDTLEHLRDFRGSILTTQTMKELEQTGVFDSLEVGNQDGLILHRLDSDGEVLQRVADLSKSQADFVETAKIGASSQSMHPEALVRTPNSSNWVPVTIRVTNEEMEALQL